MAIITLDDIRKFKDVSAHLGRKADQAIEDALDLDIKPLMGEKFFLDMKRNISQDNYKLLLSGGEYQSDDSNDDFNYNFKGLKRVMIEFAYSRIVFFGSENASPVGIVEKLTEDSKHVTRDRKKEIYTASRRTAMGFWNDVHAFLCRKEDDYEYWCYGETQPVKVSGMKLTHFRG